MKSKLSFVLLLSVFLICWTFFVLSQAFSQDNSPNWNIDPRTRIDLNPRGQYTELPQGDNSSFSNEIRYTITPQGIFAVGPNFRVHPTTARTQSETPIVRHPHNPNYMFASANTYNVGGLTTFSCGHYVTTDGGVTWFGDDTTNFNYGDPAPMIMYTDRMLISYITSTGSMGAAYSTNYGSTWSATVTFPGATTSADKNLSATDGEPGSSYYGRCYTVYTEFAGVYANRIVSTYSTDGGVTWSSIIPVSPAPSSGHHHQGCDVTVDVYGFVRVTWANCTTNGQNSTEDSLGWAESGTGGTSWSDQSNHKVNTNGIRTQSLINSIRANGFPRIASDRTCRSSADDDYVVMAEKNFAPALDNADIVLMKTADGGSSWSRVRVNQNASGSYEYFPAVDVDATGAINVCYYSTRNTPTNDSAEIYLSRSTDGGSTWVDVKVSDHKFKPVPISGTASGYQGDYIGITSGANGKIFPYWCEQNSSTGGRYQAYTATVDISMPLPACEDFSCNQDTGTASLGLTTGMLFEQFSGTNYWSRRSNASAYGIGTGAARFSCWSAPNGTIQSLVSYNFNTGAGKYISFDVAYRPFSTYVDSLILEYSTNSGTSFTIFQRLWGGAGASVGPLNTLYTSGSQLVPTASQWSPRIYSIPSSANKVRLRARSGFGNDIWLDNICIKVNAVSTVGTIGLASQGMFIPANPYWRLLDTVRVYLCRSDYPNIIVDSAKALMSGNAVSTDLNFFNALDGDYYRVVKHRNSIRTWSAVTQSFTRGVDYGNYNFIQPNGQAYGNNQAVVSTSPYYRGMYSGDIDNDGFVDGFDLLRIDNDAATFAGGYILTDLTGDNFCDGTDFAIADNNAAQFVQEVAPPGAVDISVPDLNELQKQLSAEKDPMLRKKIETCIELAKQELEKSNPVKFSYEDFHRMNNPGFVNKAGNNGSRSQTGSESNIGVVPVGKMPGEP
ncbi:MAG: hypothetical protein K1X85_13585 [Ignavibacteria bacterium]|nr:hypothetical protein [Ignavibacteria bacterium]